MGFKRLKVANKGEWKGRLFGISELITNDSLNHMYACKYTKQWTYRMERTIDYSHRKENTQEKNHG